MKIGVVFGNPEVTTGGNALKFYSSVRMEIKRTGNLKEGEAIVGSRARVKVVKNKCAPPFQEAEFDIMYGSGINRPTELVDLGVTLGLIEKAGSHFTHQGERMGQGRERAAEWLRDRVPLMDALAAQVLITGRDSGPTLMPAPVEAAA